MLRRQGKQVWAAKEHNAFALKLLEGEVRCAGFPSEKLFSPRRDIVGYDLGDKGNLADNICRPSSNMIRCPSISGLGFMRFTEILQHSSFKIFGVRSVLDQLSLLCASTDILRVLVSSFCFVVTKQCYLRKTVVSFPSNN